MTSNPLDIHQLQGRHMESPYSTILVNQYQPGQTDYEHYTDGIGGHHVVVLAVFDHDWEQHLLVQQCSTGAVARSLGMDKWEYAFYYYSSGSGVIHIRTFFDELSAPLVKAAQMVECWKQHGHYGGTQNSVESDIFDF